MFPVPFQAIPLRYLYIINKKGGTVMLKSLKSFITEADGIGTVEMILILVVLIGLVLIFKSQLTELVNSIFKTINNKAKQV
jgi:Flp pilus assembly pilin Flp